MNIFDTLCFFLFLDGPYSNYRRRRETKSQVLFWTLELEGAQLRKCVKNQNKDEKRNSMHVYLETKR